MGKVMACNRALLIASVFVCLLRKYNAEGDNTSSVVPATLEGGEKITCLVKTRCQGKILICPRECPKRKPLLPGKKACFANCGGPRCETVCKNRKPNCEGYGAMCYDPRLIGGDGIMFYFHGEKDKDFSLVSDNNFQINAHFIGRRPHGRSRDYTWVQSLGIMFGTHTFTVGANKVSKWDDNVDHFFFTFDSQPLSVSPGPLAVWKSPSAQIKVERTAETNSVVITIPNLAELSISVVPITDHDNRVHNYQMPSDDCFAHLQTQFNFFSLSSEVEGVLGQTYRPNFKNPVKVGVAMPIMGGEDKYETSSLLEADCKACIFRPASSSAAALDDTFSGQVISSLDCTSNFGLQGRGIACRR